MRKAAIAILLILSLTAATFLLFRHQREEALSTLLATTSAKHLAEAAQLLTALGAQGGPNAPATIDSAQVIAPMLLMTRAAALLRIYAVEDVQLMGRVYALSSAVTDLEMMVLIQHTLTPAQQAQVQAAVSIDQELAHHLAGKALPGSSALPAALSTATAGSLRSAVGLYALLNRLDLIDTSQVTGTLGSLSHTAALFQVYARDDSHLQALSAALEQAIGTMQHTVLIQHTLTPEERAAPRQALELLREAQRDVAPAWATR